MKLPGTLNCPMKLPGTLNCPMKFVPQNLTMKTHEKLCMNCTEFQNNRRNRVGKREFQYALQNIKINDPNKNTFQGL